MRRYEKEDREGRGGKEGEGGRGVVRETAGSVGS